VKLKALAAYLEADLYGDEELDLKSVASIEVATENDLSFVLEKKFVSCIKTSKAKAFIVFERLDTKKSQLVVKNPRKAMAQAIRLFYPESDVRAKSHATAFVEVGAVVHGSVSLGAYVVVGAHTEVNEGGFIHSHCSIGRNCKIGKKVVLYPHVTIYDGVIIGDNVIIHSGSVIGADGFGYYQDRGKWGKIPQVGHVLIEDDVEIGANCTIDRAALYITKIGRGTKLDNMVHIAHNVSVGEDCVIAAQTAFAGGASAGNHVIIAGQVAIDASVGDNVIIYAKSGVTKDVKPNAVISGFPAWDHKDEMKKQALIRKLSKKRS
jgi:UDP-3-O-[3-hydroxymyristoyl] glucosamine N-acyltransferase